MYNSANANAADIASTFSEFTVERTVSEWNARFQKLRWEALMGDGDNAARRFLSGPFLGISTFAAAAASDNDNDDYDVAVSVSPPPGHLLTQEHPLITSPSSTTQYQSFSSASSAFSDYSPSIAFHESQQVSHTGLAQEYLPDPSPFPQDDFSSTRMSFADRPITDANRGRKRRASTSGPSSSSFDSTAEIGSVPKKRHIHYRYADDIPAECLVGFAAAELSTPLQPITSNSSSSSSNNKDVPAAVQYCNIHGRSSHSTEECRARQTAALKLGSSPSPTDTPPVASGKTNRSNKYCDFHNCIGHTTEECRLRGQITKQATKAVLKALYPSQSKVKGKGNGNGQGNSKGNSKGNGKGNSKGNSKGNNKGKGSDKGKSIGNGDGKTMTCPRCGGQTPGKGHRCNSKLSVAHLRTQKGKTGKPVRAKKASAPVKSSSAGSQSAAEA